jgi:fluoride exporter
VRERGGRSRSEQWVRAKAAAAPSPVRGLTPAATLSRGAGEGLSRADAVWVSCLWVAVGSALGGVGRFALSVLIAERLHSLFPWGTLIVNVSGCFAIGLFGALTGPDGRFPTGVSPRLLVMVGICGGYTTFSAFSLQALDLMRLGDWQRAGAYVAASVVLCLLAVWLGHLAALAVNRW